MGFDVCLYKKKTSKQCCNITSLGYTCQWRLFDLRLDLGTKADLRSPGWHHTCKFGDNGRLGGSGVASVRFGDKGRLGVSGVASV